MEQQDYKSGVVRDVDEPETLWLGSFSCEVALTRQIGALFLVHRVIGAALSSLSLPTSLRFAISVVKKIKRY
jgi:hypothetical protein